MCAISGSFDPKKLAELCKANEYRGTHSHSLALFDCRDLELIGVERKLGPMNYDHISTMKKYPNNEVYYIAHQQAPTGAQTTKKCIHPAVKHTYSDYEELINSEYLYHNGILKDKQIEKLQEEYNVDANWDTYLLLLELSREIPYKKIDIDGSFACLYIKSWQYPKLFRNAMCPMFVDDELNVSSTKFSESRSIKANTVYTMNFNGDKLSLHEDFSFKTKNMPYYIEE